MKVVAEADLTLLNTLKVSTEAAYLAYAAEEDDVLEAIRFARDQELSIKVLGGGSNVVMPRRVDAVVLKLQNETVEVLQEDALSVLVKVGAGFDWHQWVMMSLEQEWFGLENLAYIPGTVGAAPVQNIGAYGVEVESFIRRVHYVDLASEECHVLDHDDCHFAYRESIFKQELDQKVVITAVEFSLSKIARPNFEYAPLNQMALEKGAPTPQELARWVIDVRKSKLPDPTDIPNAGSFFKNPIVSDEDFVSLKSKFADMPSYQQPNGVKIPAGWLIDQLGYKGKLIGRVGVHAHQALVLVNNGGDANDIEHAASVIKADVLSVYGVELEQEPRLF